MTKLISMYVLAVSICFISHTSLANTSSNNSQWTVTAMGYYAQLHDSDDFDVASGGEFDDSSAVALNVGYIYENIIFEAGVITTGDFEYTGSLLNDSYFSLDGYQLNIGGQRYFTENFGFDFKVGLMFWEIDAVYETDFKLDGYLDGESWTASGALKYSFGNHVDALIEYLHIADTISDKPMNLAGLGIRVKF